MEREGLYSSFYRMQFKEEQGLEVQKSTIKLPPHQRRKEHVGWGGGGTDK
jgi:hypothetical protein